MPNAKNCPICKKPSTQAHTPFCSQRCTDVDLNRWLTASYVVSRPITPSDELEDLPDFTPETDDNRLN